MAADSSLDDVLRLLTKKKKKTQDHGASGVSSFSKGTKKRQRSGSVSSKDVADVDPLKRLEAFRERMFDPTLQVNTHVKTSHANPEDAVLLAKWKTSKDGSSSKKKRKTAAFGAGGVDGDNDDDMPRVTVKATRSSDKSEKKMKKKEEKESAKSKVVKIPGQSGSIAALTLSSQHKLNSHQLKKEPQAASVKMLPKKRMGANAKSTLGSSLEKPKLDAVVQENPAASLEDPLEKALQSVKEQLQTRKSKGDDDDKNQSAVDANEAVQQKEKKNRRRKKKEKKKNKRQEAAKPSLSSDTAAEPKKEEADAVIKEVDTASAPAVKEVVKVVVAAQQEAPRPLKPTKSDQSADTSLTARGKKEMKKKRYATMNVSVMLASEPSKKSPMENKEAIKDDQTVAKPSPPPTTTPKQNLVVETIKEDQQVAKLTETLEQQDRPPCPTSTTSESVVESDSDIAGSIVQKDEQPPKPVQRKRLIRGSDTEPTISAAAAATEKKEGVSDMLPPAPSAATAASAVAPSSPSKRQKRAKLVHEPPAKPAATKATFGAVTKSQKKKPKSEEPPQFIKEEVDDDMDDSEGEHGAEALSHGQKEIFSSLIDEAARQQWELVEVGRLVKLFAGQWSHRTAKTARFLRRYCPELVNVDFLEGLDAKLRPEQIVKIFDRGSGNTTVLMNKIASAVENGHVNVSDVAVLDMLASKMQQMATNHDVLEFLHPLLESVSTVRDVSRVLKHVCAHWHVDRTMTLVQQILLTSVFDDLDGNQDEILQDLPELAGKLDFPSRLDQEDADENGNLIGLIANEDSDLGEDDEQEVDAEYEAAEDALGEIHSDHEDSEESDEDDEEYEGETDSEEERKAMAVMSGQSQPRRRSRFILDEADEDDEEESELETEEDDEEEEDEDDDDDDEADFGKGGKGTEHGGRRQRMAKTTMTKAADSSESESSDETWRSKPKAPQ